MTLRILFVFTIVFFFVETCVYRSGKAVSDVSRVEHFEYAGYSDTIYAVIYGRVYEKRKTAKGLDTLMPLSHVDVLVEKNGKLGMTDRNGDFAIGLDKGVFSLMVSKQGYEPIQVTNYVSDPDRVSFTKIVLAKGKEQRTFQVPKWTR
jgi:hypothetical protein